MIYSFFSLQDWVPLTCNQFDVSRSAGFLLFRDPILTRYAMFLQSLNKDNSKEIRMLASILSVDRR
jgi:hypothetical protein